MSLQQLQTPKYEVIVQGSKTDPDNARVFVKFFGISDKLNDQNWRVTKQSIPENMPTAINKPLVLYPYPDFHPTPPDKYASLEEHILIQEPYRVGTILDYSFSSQAGNSKHASSSSDIDTAYVSTEITHPILKKAYMTGDLSLVPPEVSPAIYHYDRDQFNISKWVWLHLAVVPKGSFGQVAKAVASCSSSNPDDCISRLKIASSLANTECKLGCNKTVEEGLRKIASSSVTSQEQNLTKKEHKMTEGQTEGNAQIQGQNTQENQETFTSGLIKQPASGNYIDPNNLAIKYGDKTFSFSNNNQEVGNITSGNGQKISEQGQQQPQNQEQKEENKENDEVAQLRETVAKLQADKELSDRKSKYKDLIEEEAGLLFTGKDGKFNNQALNKAVEYHLKKNHDEETIKEIWSLRRQLASAQSLIESQPRQEQVAQAQLKTASSSFITGQVPSAAYEDHGQSKTASSNMVDVRDFSSLTTNEKLRAMHQGGSY